jgi:hypothetical protein
VTGIPASSFGDDLMRRIEGIFWPGWSEADFDHDARLCDRQELLVDASNRAYDLAERQEGTPVGDRAAVLSEVLADRFDVVGNQITEFRR